MRLALAIDTGLATGAIPIRAAGLRLGLTLAVDTGLALRAVTIGATGSALGLTLAVDTLLPTSAVLIGAARRGRAELFENTGLGLAVDLDTASSSKGRITGAVVYALAVDRAERRPLGRPQTEAVAITGSPWSTGLSRQPSRYLTHPANTALRRLAVLVCAALRRWNTTVLLATCTGGTVLVGLAHDRHTFPLETAIAAGAVAIGAAGRSHTLTIGALLTLGAIFVARTLWCFAFAVDAALPTGTIVVRAAGR